MASIDLAEVISLVPNRQLTHGEALVVAEIQAMKLLRLGDVLKPPVPVADLAKRAGVVIEYRPFVDEVGALVSRNGRWHIRHASLDKPSIYATVAHQLKILLDQPFGDHLYPHQDVMAPQLRRHHVAEYFATTLTMPHEWIEQLWRQGEHDLKALARLFATTPSAMAFRLRALRLIGHDAVPVPSTRAATPTSTSSRSGCPWSRPDTWM